jgi:tyrosyl-tRNA synthetase
MLEKRYEYYKEAIPAILKMINVPINKLEFIRGKDIQLNEKYQFDLLKLSTISSVRDSTRAASDVVKMGDKPKLSGLLYPLMQALDEEYLKVDAQLGGNDQRKIMVYSREILPKIGYGRRIELLTPIIRGLVGEKMSSSVDSSKIDLMDDERTVSKKMNKADCIAGDPNNGVMALLEYFIFRIKGDKGEKFIIKRDKKYGGNLEYKSYKDLEKDFKEKKLHPLDLKNGTAEEINKILENFRINSRLKKLHKIAYP